MADEATSTNNRIVWADALKGLLIVLVVLGHSIQASMIKLGDSFIDDYVWNLIYSFHMPSFIAISGFLVYRKGIIGGGNLNDWISVSYRRFRQLVTPFLLWSIALFFVNHNVAHIYDYIFYPKYSLWFLWALFFITIIFSGVDKLASKWNISQELFMAVCWFLQIIVMFVMPNAKLFGIDYIAYYFFYYVLGYYMHKYSELLIIRKGLVIAVLGVLWFALGSIYSTQGLPKQLQFIPLIPTSLMYYAYRITTATIAIFFLFSFGIKTMDKKSSLISCIVAFGKVSLGIYAVHMVIRFRLVDAIVCLIPDINYWPLMFVTFLMLVPMSYGIVWLFGKWSVTSTLLLGKLS